MSMSLADHLRALPDEALAELLRARPDLTVPLPGDLSALANRAQTRLSVARALEALDLFTLEVLDALRLLGAGPAGTPAASLDAVLTVTAPYVAETRAAVDRLRALLLVHGPDTALRPVSVLDEVCSAYPAGLGRPAADLGDSAATELAADPAALRRTIMSAPPEARAVLDTLAAGPPVGSLTEARTAKTDDSPVRWLLNRRLLVPISDDAVELPREVGLLLRRDDGPLGQLHPAPPTLPTKKRGAAVDQAGAGQAIEVVRLVDVLVNALPAPILKAGGLSARDLKRVARTAGVEENTAGLLLEVAYSAGLIGVLDGGGTGGAHWLPTAVFDTWLAAGLAERWQILADAWLRMPRQAALIGTRDERDRPMNALSGELARSGAPALRAAVLAMLTELPAGTGAETADVLAVLRWRSPRRFTRPTLLGAALAEAATLGLTAMGALTSYGRALLAPESVDDPLGVLDRAPGSVTILAALLPAPVDQVLLQADLTIVVPGPASAGLAAELASVAVPESPSVYRVSVDSLRGALDSGYASTDLHALFARRSTTPVPQALTYLIDDVSRKHGGLRAGSASAYLRSEDEALLAEIAADRRLSGLAFRRLAPTVLVSPYPIARVVDALRDTGYSPVPEDATGVVLLTRATPRRAPTAGFDRSSGQPLELPEAYLAGIVEELRISDARARAARKAPVMVTGSIDDALAVLRDAIRDRVPVWVGYIDPHGSTISRLVRPMSIGAGYLRAEDERSETLHTFALARITSATLA
ncbi:helicase-associated domain-containing protein [Longispora sp. NPDC051575]|uniref:helicase-associated domain-containing protein n=1 Tax=Longispora sp. NPDC051575 TaxID=3154943 RepID=UPI003445E778